MLTFLLKGGMLNREGQTTPDDEHSMASWTAHLDGARMLLRIRGPELLRRGPAYRMFNMLRQQIVSPFLAGTSVQVKIPYISLTIIIPTAPKQHDVPTTRPTRSQRPHPPPQRNPRLGRTLGKQSHPPILPSLRLIRSLPPQTNGAPHKQGPGMLSARRGSLGGPWAVRARARIRGSGLGPWPA